MGGTGSRPLVQAHGWQQISVRYCKFKLFPFNFCSASFTVDGAEYFLQLPHPAFGLDFTCAVVPVATVNSCVGLPEDLRRPTWKWNGSAMVLRGLDWIPFWNLTNKRGNRPAHLPLSMRTHGLLQRDQAGVHRQENRCYQNISLMVKPTYLGTQVLNLKIIGLEYAIWTGRFSRIYQRTSSDG